jgi:hypothetical protein
VSERTDRVVEAAQEVCDLAGRCMQVERRRGELLVEVERLGEESRALFSKLYKAQAELNRLADGKEAGQCKTIV